VEEAAAMRDMLSPGTGRHYPLTMICAVFRVPPRRSTGPVNPFYDLIEGRSVMRLELDCYELAPRLLFLRPKQSAETDKGEHNEQ
jgi:hypothetical protein